MTTLTTTPFRRKRQFATILLIDAVEWSDAYPAKSPLRNVGEWFARHLRDEADLYIKIANARDRLSPSVLDGYEGVILSGSPSDAWVDDPVNRSLAGLILACRDRQLPFLGVCFGHQLLAHVLGGNVARNPKGVELGVVPLELTDAGRQSPLFAGFPAKFEALESHQDAVLSLPPGAELLAQGEHTHIQAFRCDPCLMGVQFHPEMDPDIVRFLWEPRRAAAKFNVDEKLATLRPLPAVAKLLNNFANLCLEKIK
jgi:GMP synthase (glutamine-hydrolysing)